MKKMEGFLRQEGDERFYWCRNPWFPQWCKTHDLCNRPTALKARSRRNGGSYSGSKETKKLLARR
jgi:hypothetical protein